MSKSRSLHDANTEPFDLFRGGGETGGLLRQFDWASSPLGPPQSWPQSLKTAVRIMMTSRQPMWVGWGNELIYLYNDAYFDIIGGKHPAALGRPVLEVWPELRDDILPMLRQAMDTGRGIYVEDQLLLMERHGYAEETYYTYSYSPISDEQGVAGGIICVNTDETQRVFSERQLATLQYIASETNEARSWQETCDGCMAGLGVNPKDILFALLFMPPKEGGALKLSGRLRLHESHPFSQLHYNNILAGNQPLQQALTNNKPMVVDIHALPEAQDLPSGPWQKPAQQVLLLPVLPNADPLRAGVLLVGLNPYRLFDQNYRSFMELIAGQIGAALANVQAFEEARLRAEALAEIDHAKTLFFSNVSHEFRTPLTLILGPLERLLTDAVLPLDVYRELRLVERNGLRLLKLVNSLLDFSRVEAGRVQAAFFPTELDRLTTHLASHFRSAFDQAGVALHVDCPPLAQPVYVDVTMWEKIVFNLLSNAFKFTFKGEVSVVIREFAYEVELEIVDTGIGIPATELENVFKRFHRVENSGGRTHEGSGIGLALVQELVKIHGGTVSVASEVDKGTRFNVRLPKGYRHLPGDQVGSPVRGDSSAIHADAYVQEALRWLPEAELVARSYDAAEADLPLVILADDNADMRTYITRVLAGKYQVLSFGDGQTALENIQQQPPALVISDVMMPYLDGFELLAAIRTMPEFQELPVILLSARAGEEAEIEGLRAGADDYLVKPFSARELVARVESLLNRQAQRREQETHFRMIADSVPAMLWTTSVDGQRTYLSAEWYKVTGGHAGDDLGEGWTLKIHPDDFQQIGKQFSSSNDQRAPFRLLYRLCCETGDYRWVIDSGIPRFDDQHRFVGFVGCVFDVHERVLAEERSRASEEKLKETDRRKDEFLATLAHELRNPLAPISNAAKILQVTEESGQRQAALSTIDRQLQQLVRLVDDLMDVSRITRGKVELRTTTLDLMQVIQSAVEATTPLIRKNEQRLRLTLPDDAIWLNGDMTRLSQIFTNILNNASKYTAPGGAITLAVAAQKDEVCVKITDTGIGIPDEKLDLIFDMFLQLDSSIGRTQGGLGIGLTLVKQLVMLHGGRITVASAGPNQGSCFTVFLPRIEQAPAARPGSVNEPAKAAQNLRILVVDDNEESARTLTELLTLLGYECAGENRASLALQKMNEFKPDVALLDIGMPEIDGYELCRRIKAHPVHHKVVCIAQTGWGEKHHVDRALEVGFDQHLVKPIDINKLRELLASLST